ncbi:integrase [Nesterenkonia jeotgali]|uniref:Integrase n=2 Tax=Nesterenkonia jeotgali TaxID=317018 RepID=A0A0W8IC31_9MICC|nr:integrase [Nesterenkonia jeotgali]
MATSGQVDLRVGCRVWLDGSVWTLAELGADGALLISGQSLKRVQTSYLVSVCKVLTEEAEIQESETVPPPSNVLLTSLSAGQESRVRAQSEAVRLAQDPPNYYSGTRAEWMRDCAKNAGVSFRTLQRWMRAHENGGPAALADNRTVSKRSSGVDERWVTACRAVLTSYVEASTPTADVVLEQTKIRLEGEYGPGQVPVPSRATQYRKLKDISKGRHAFGSAKQRRSVAQRPDGPYGRLIATRPGEYVVLDTTPLDVFAMEPVTLRWVPVELTVAQDLYTRCILGLRLSPVSTNSADVANVLYQTVTPMPNSASDGAWPFHGVPKHVLVGRETNETTERELSGGLPACLPESIVIDRGRTYLSDHVISACARLGISVQPAIPYKPTDKPTVERFFKTLRESFLQHLPGYKGPDVYNRGKNVEQHAFYYLSELEQMIRQWVGQDYHHRPHRGLCVPEVPGASFSPSEMFEVGLAKTGGLRLPASESLAFLFLDVEWRTIQHYGVEVHGRRYDGPALNFHRNSRSPYTGVNRGKWPIFVDAHDVRRVWFQDLRTKSFEPLEWEHAAALDGPFSKEAAEYTKKIVLREKRHVDPSQAIQQLLLDWRREEVTARRDKSLARRLSAARESTGSAVGVERDRAPTSGVLDLNAARHRKRQNEPISDLDDVFGAFYSTYPEGALEVFDE